MNSKIALFVFLIGLILLNERVNVNALPASPLRARQNNVNALGSWSIVGNSGVQAMHAVLVAPRKVVFIDKLEQNALKRPDGQAALSAEYNLDTNTVKALSIYSNTFCSAGSWLANGTLVEVGGDVGDAKTAKGDQTLRLYDPNVGDWVELENVMPSNRWYPAMVTLPSGSVMVVGGAKSGVGQDTEALSNPTYAIYPPPTGVMTDVPLDFLTTALPYNLYPVVHVIPGYDGKTNLFIFANQAGMIYNLDTNTKVSDIPKIGGGIRSYPLSGTSIMLPLSPTDYYKPTIMICGGNTAFEITSKSDSTCGRLELTTPGATWEMDTFGNMPRVMPDVIFLVDGTIFFCNGAGTGYAGFHKGSATNPLWVADNPVLTPLLYDPNAKTYTPLAPSTIPRMYHSVSTLIPDGTVLVTGSNPQPNVDLKIPKFPTEYRVEIFTPPYLYSSIPRPAIVSFQSSQINQNRIPVTYGQDVTMVVQIKSNGSSPSLKAAMIHHGFVTHSQHFSQRYVYLEIENFWMDTTTSDQYIITAKLPPNPTIIAPGPSYIYVFNYDSPCTTGVEVLLNTT